jgi:hypothetical protein
MEVIVGKHNTFHSNQKTEHLKQSGKHSLEKNQATGAKFKYSKEEKNWKLYLRMLLV